MYRLFVLLNSISCCYNVACYIFTKSHFFDIQNLAFGILSSYFCLVLFHVVINTKYCIQRFIYLLDAVSQMSYLCTLFYLFRFMWYFFSIPSLHLNSNIRVVIYLYVAPSLKWQWSNICIHSDFFSKSQRWDSEEKISRSARSFLYVKLLSGSKTYYNRKIFQDILANKFS